MQLRARQSAGPPPVPTRNRGGKVKAFQYQPLDPLKREIRLLELAPGKPDSRIAAHIFNVSLDDSPKFEALSYTWGPPRPNYDIAIDGKPFTVGRNLRKALDDLRFADRPRVVWTDAVCINQTDNDEKSHQIKLMRTIYGCAQVVCAWIDHSVPLMNPVFEDLEKLGEGVEINDFHDPSYWYPVADIFRNPYWRRLWIQQELILAARIQIYCRRDSFDGQKLLEFQHRVNNVYYQVLGYSSPERIISRYIDGTEHQIAVHPQVLGGGIIRSRENLRQGREIHGEKADKVVDTLKITNRVLGSSLLHLFLQSLGLNMVDQRDRVYGVLGMAADVDVQSINVDYNAPVVSVFAVVFQHFLTKYKSLSFLPFESDKFQDRIPRRDDLPSWMPHATMSWGPINNSRACGTALADRASIDTKSLILSAQGLHCDTISFMGPGRDPLQEQQPPVPEWLAQVEGICERLWPHAKDRPLYERDHVTSLFFPWLSEDRYGKANKGRLEKLDAKRRTQLLRDMLAAAGRVDDPGDFSVDRILRGGYRPTNVLPQDTRESILPMGPEINSNVLFGTEGGRLGRTRRTSPVAPGDQIWIIFGCRMPLILRPITGKRDRFTILGPTIVPPIMRGEALRDGGEARSRVIEIE
ncbi:hypothetical protein ACO1O0_001647 [Amphichorda felina]